MPNTIRCSPPGAKASAPASVRTHLAHLHHAFIIHGVGVQLDMAGTIHARLDQAVGMALRERCREIGRRHVAALRVRPDPRIGDLDHRGNAIVGQRRGRVSRFGRCRVIHPAMIHGGVHGGGVFGRFAAGRQGEAGSGDQGIVLH
jgi:hypothetical protein